MKTWILGLFILVGQVAFAQKMHREKIFSKELKDTVEFRIWVPEVWDENTIFQTIYTVEDTEDELLAKNVEFYRNSLPKTLVVGILNGRSLIKYDHPTLKLKDKGAEFISCLSKEIMPFIDGRYKTSPFRAFMGHSYSANYANYLLLHNHGLFNAFILISPEKWGIPEGKPAFTLDSNSVRYYSNHKVIYYMSAGGKDLARRIDYANEVSAKLKVLDTNYFFFCYKFFPEANHITTVPNSIPGALEHIFKPYYQLPGIDSVANALNFFNQTKAAFNEIYGLPLEKNSLNSYIFAYLASKNSDLNTMKAMEDYFIDDNTNSLVLINFARLYDNVGLKERARSLYELSIARAKRDESNTINGSKCLVLAYTELANKIYKDNKVKAWETLQNALKDKDVKEPVLNFYLGKLSVDLSLNPKKGLDHLLLYEKYFLMQGKMTWDIEPETAYVTIAKCYLLLKDKIKCKSYLEKALKANPEQKEAMELMRKVS